MPDPAQYPDPRGEAWPETAAEAQALEDKRRERELRETSTDRLLEDVAVQLLINLPEWPAQADVVCFGLPWRTRFALEPDAVEEWCDSLARDVYNAPPHAVMLALAVGIEHGRRLLAPAPDDEMWEYTPRPPRDVRPAPVVPVLSLMTLAAAAERYPADMALEDAFLRERESLGTPEITLREALRIFGDGATISEAVDRAKGLGWAVGEVD